MEDPLAGHSGRGRARLGFARVEVAVPAREVAGGDLDPYAVPCPEDDAGRPQVHDVLGGLTRCRCPYPHDAVSHIAGDVLLVDVTQAGHPVGRGPVRGGEEHRPHTAGHLDVLGERFGREDEDVLARLHRRPVERSGTEVVGHQQRPADRGHRVRRVVGELLGLFGGGRGFSGQASVRAQVEVRVHGPRQGPFRLLAPLVDAHDEQQHPARVRLQRLAVADRAPEPVELEAVQGPAHAHEGGVRAEPEVDVADDVLLVGVMPTPPRSAGRPVRRAVPGR